MGVIKWLRGLKVNVVSKKDLQAAQSNVMWGFPWGYSQSKTGLNIDEEKELLTVTIPQDFLNVATYPIYQAAGLEFGYSTEGTAGDHPLGDVLVGCRFTTTAAFDVDDIQFYGEMGGGG